MYEKMHDVAGARETQGVGLELPSIFIITFIRERRRRLLAGGAPRCRRARRRRAELLTSQPDYLFRIVSSSPVVELSLTITF